MDDRQDVRNGSAVRARVAGRAAAVWLAMALVAACGRPDALVVRGLRPVDPEEGSDASPVTLLVVDGRIDCMGPDAACPAPAEARVVDAGGRWVVPGLVDPHVALEWDDAPRRTARDQALRFTLGITTVGDSTTADPALARPRLARAASADEPSPRIVPAGPARALAPERRVPPAPGSLAIEADLEGIRGLDGIPAAVLGGGVAPPDSTPAERIEAWRRGLWLEADPARLDTLARALARRGVWLEPLLAVEASFADPYRVPYELRRLLELPWVMERLLTESPAVPDPDGRETMAAAVERMRRFVRAFHDAGGRVIAGTGDHPAPGLALHEEMRQLAEAGLGPVEAIRAATREAAAVLGVDDRLGSLEPGKLADFVILEEDPRLDIARTHRIWRIGKGGRLYDPNVLYDELTREPGILSESWQRLVVALLAIAAALLALAWAIHRSAKGPPDPGPRRVRWG